MTQRHKQNKSRLDQRLIELEYFSDLKRATSWIMDHKVVVDGKVCTKPGTMIRADANIHVRGRALKFTSRGGHKLHRALREFDVDPSGMVVLDAGASTGGFTDCLVNATRKKAINVEALMKEAWHTIETSPPTDLLSEKGV